MTTHSRAFLLLSSLLALASGVLLICTDPKQAGGETVNENTCALFMPDGVTPAVDADVAVFDPGDTSRTAVFETTTDADGNYSLDGQGLSGEYNVWFQLDTMVAYQDSVVISTSTKTANVDTLEDRATLSGIVKMQPGHTPRSVTVQALGTYAYGNVNDEGWFTVTGLASGEYTIRLTTTLPDYVDTFFTKTVNQGAVDTIPDTLWLPYIGIPAVLGLNATYDTVSGTANLSWDSVDYYDFQEYLIYRADYDTLIWPASAIGRSQATAFADSVFSRSVASGQYSFSDTNDYHLKYRVTVRNNSDDEGRPYGYVSVIAASPAEVKTVFSFTKWHLAKGFYTDSCSVNDSMRITVDLSNSTRGIAEVSWLDAATGDTLRTRTLRGRTHERDTLVEIWDSLGTRRIECVATDQAGTEWRDTVEVFVVEDLPSVRIVADSVIYLGVPCTLHVDASDKYGEIASIEWDIGGTANWRAGGVDTVIVVEDTLTERHPVGVRVLNGDGEQGAALSYMPIELHWARVGEVFGTGSPSAAFSIGDTVWVLLDRRCWAWSGSGAPEIVGDTLPLFRDICMRGEEAFAFYPGGDYDTVLIWRSVDRFKTWDPAYTRSGVSSTLAHLFSFRDTVWANGPVGGADCSFLGKTTTGSEWELTNIRFTSDGGQWLSFRDTLWHREWNDTKFTYTTTVKPDAAGNLDLHPTQTSGLPQGAFTSMYQGQFAVMGDSCLFFSDGIAVYVSTDVVNWRRCAAAPTSGVLCVHGGNVLSISSGGIWSAKLPY